eukprot:GDKI01020608.1.p1 GENE.GDKI01020608.1~~GDKI01020608.1.p1  ORF type:complete len:503 (-),score=110.64 GDKI01020608.1:98-1606(-)
MFLSGVRHAVRTALRAPIGVRTDARVGLIAIGNQQVRYKASFLKQKLDRNTRLDVQQHYEYTKKLTRPPEYDLPDKLVLSKKEWNDRHFKSTLGMTHSHPIDAHMNSQETQEEVQQMTDKQQLLDALSAPKLEGFLTDMKLDKFGDISVYHGDIFEERADVLVVPMVANFLPHKGISLRVLEKGGQSLLKEAYAQVKELLQTRRAAVEAFSKEAGVQLTQAEKKERLEANVRLHIGDVIVTSPHGVNPHIHSIAFVVTPYYFQGGPTDAARRFRYTVKNVFRAVADKDTVGGGVVMLPHIGAGVYGYEPSNACDILAQEAVECLLQLETTTPTYTIRHIKFVDRDHDTARTLGESVSEQRTTWVPQYRLTTAPQFHSRQSRRLLEVTPWVVTRCLRRTATSFKHYHSIIRRRQQHWFRNIQPFMWRTQKVNEPPPLLVYKQTGHAAPLDDQLPARPHYFRGVSHALFPKERPGFKTMRMSKHGDLRGQNKMPDIFDEIRPKQ